MNNCVFIGNLVRDPEIRYTDSGIAICSFSIAVQQDFKNKETGNREADFINCVAWRKTAELINEHFTKGKPIAITGSMRNESYNNRDGVKINTYKIHVDKFEFVRGQKDEPGDDSVNEQKTVPNEQFEKKNPDIPTEEDSELPF